VTPAPVPQAELTQPVELGAEQCYVVRAVQVAGGATTEGPSSAVVCVTPVDQYPPPAPANLRAVQEGASITLTWTGSTATDLAGYIVLRGDAAAESMQPLMRDPIRGTTFSDSTAQAGVTYTYSVYAVDTAPAANISQQSNRQVVTVR